MCARGVHKQLKSRRFDSSGLQEAQKSFNTIASLLKLRFHWTRLLPDGGADELGSHHIRHGSW